MGTLFSPLLQGKKSVGVHCFLPYCKGEKSVGSIVFSLIIRGKRV